MLKDTIKWTPKWTVRKYHTDEDYTEGRAPYEVIEFDGNLLLNEGITELLTLLIGGAATAFNNTNAKLGVGDSATAASATDTGLLGTSKLYKAMEASYPSVASQTVTFRAVFGTSEANFAWNEVSVSNNTDDTGVNLNRKVQSLGTKASGTWTLDLAITLS